MKKTVVVTSIFGRQQAAVAAEFHRLGWSVRGTARKGGSHEFADIRRTDISGGAELTDAFLGADVVAYSLVQDYRPSVTENMAKAVANAAAEAGVKRIVFNLAGTIDQASDQPPSIDNRAARAAIQQGSVPATVLQPTVYMDNLLEPWCLPAILNEGVFAYPAPANAPISWLSHRSLAAYIAAAAEDENAAAKEFRVGGPSAITGAEMARMLSEHIHRDIRYKQLPLDIMAAGLNDAMGAPTGDRIVALYARLDREPGFMDLSDTSGVSLGAKPESFADFVARSQWSLPETVVN